MNEQTNKFNEQTNKQTDKRTNEWTNDLLAETAEVILIQRAPYERASARIHIFHFILTDSISIGKFTLHIARAACNIDKHQMIDFCSSSIF